MSGPKTPVSILQEMMVKKKMVPNYELVHDGGGSHLNSFTYKVSCDGCSGIGTGRNKKDAKHMAAKNVLDAIVARNNLPQIEDTPIESPKVSPSLKKDTPEHGSDRPFVNAIGVLQDLCCNHDLGFAEYVQISDVGPPHARVFTVQCKVSSFTEEAKAKTKKQAKHEAAQKMLDTLRNVVGVEVDDIINSKTFIPADIEEKTEEASKRFSELSKVHSKKKTLGAKVSDYYKLMKRSVPEENLEEFIKSCNEYLEKIPANETEMSKELFDEIMTSFKEFLEKHEFDVNGFWLPASDKKTPKFLYLMEVTSATDIVEIGLGKTEIAAKFNALEKVLNAMLLFLT